MLLYTLGYRSLVTILTWLCIPVFLLVMCPYFNIHTCSWVPVLKFILGHWSPCWFSHLVYVLILIISFWHVSNFNSTFDHIFICWYLHLVMYPHVDIHTCSCIAVMVLNLLHVLLCCYSHLVTCTHFDIHTCSRITVLTLLIICPHWYFYLVMYPSVNVHPWSSFTV